jgi:hypothetical protein
MPKEFLGRIHGDGRLTVDDSFYSPISEDETPQYLKVLTNILDKAKITMTINPQDLKLPRTLLALKQRFIIGFSNGCPWPEKAISKYLLKQTAPPTTLEELTTLIKDSALFDGKHSFLFQSLLESASKPLKDALLSYHPWRQLEGQEDHNLPQDITNPHGKGAFGLAYDPPFFEVLIPLYRYIDDDENIGTHQARYFAVTDFFEKVANKTLTIEEFIEQTKGFLSHPDKYLRPHLINHKQS